jgi:hypothetical protein
VTAVAYPLTWPTGVARTASPAPAPFHRQVTRTSGGGNGVPATHWRSRAQPTVAETYAEVVDELKRIKAQGVIISTNIPVKNDGTPWADKRPINGDVGVAVYWSLHVSVGGRLELVPHSIQCDKWNSVAANLHAVALSLEALRGVQRWGAVSQHQVLRGFRALPGAADVDAPPPRRSWREVLEVPEGGWTAQAPAEAVLAFAKAQYKTMSARMHPDRAAPDDRDEATRRYSEVNEAMEEAERELARPA